MNDPLDTELSDPVSSGIGCFSSSGPEDIQDKCFACLVPPQQEIEFPCPANPLCAAS